MRKRAVPAGIKLLACGNAALSILWLAQLVLFFVSRAPASEAIPVWRLCFGIANTGIFGCLAWGLLRGYATARRAVIIIYTIIPTVFLSLTWVTQMTFFRQTIALNIVFLRSRMLALLVLALAWSIFFYLKRSSIRSFFNAST
jgi:hypothetical protein